MILSKTLQSELFKFPANIANLLVRWSATLELSVYEAFMHFVFFFVSETPRQSFKL